MLKQLFFLLLQLVGRLWGRADGRVEVLGADEVGVSGSKHVEGGDMSLEGGNGGRAVFLLFFFHLFFQARAGRAGAMLVSAAPSNGLVFHRTSERQHFRTVNTIKKP